MSEWKEGRRILFLCRNIVKKLITVIVVIAMFTAFMPAIACADETGETPQEKNCALTTEHVRYISPDSLGKFSPTKKLTKGAAAQMIYNLLAEKPEGQVFCDDVNEKTAYGKAIAALLYLDIVGTDKDGNFHPKRNITKGQLESMLAKCTGKEVTSKSADTIERGAAVRLINRALGRENTDKHTILKGSRIRIFTDVPVDSKYYYDVMEASIGHTLEENSEGGENWTHYNTEQQGISGSGWKVIDGESYYVDKEAKIIRRSCTINDSNLDKNGRYTTGNKKLDKQLVKVFKEQTKNAMSNKEKLKAVYTYIYKNCTYQADIKRKPSKNCTSWDKNLAYKMLKNKKGNCYYYAAAATYAARKCGYDARTISGYVTYNQNKYYMQHGWTEIKKEDGTKRFLDTELQYLSYKGGWGSDYFMRPYGTMKKMHHKHYYKKGGPAIRK